MMRLLTSGKRCETSVLDFQANTRASRTWMRGLIEAADVPHTLHYLDVPDAVCKARLHLRNARGDHAFAVTDEQFEGLMARWDSDGSGSIDYREFLMLFADDVQAGFLKNIKRSREA